MTTFQEFLKKKVEETKDTRERRERRDEWVAAVGRLLDQIRTWLAEADPDHYLDVLPITVMKWERALGSYDISSLRLGVGGISITVDPIGRNSIGEVKRRGAPPLRAEGRVDITNGSRKYILYRTLEDGKETWYALNERFEAEPFDRECLERILQDLLS